MKYTGEAVLSLTCDLCVETDETKDDVSACLQVIINMNQNKCLAERMSVTLRCPQLS